MTLDNGVFFQRTHSAGDVISLTPVTQRHDLLHLLQGFEDTDISEVGFTLI